MAVNTASTAPAETPEIEPRKLSKIETEYQTELQAVYATATEEDHAVAQSMRDIGSEPRRRGIKPVVAAIIMREMNLKNRDFRVSKSRRYLEAMQRGEWKLNHQGIAFYANGTLADGQHRMGALAVSKLPELPFMVSSNFDDEAIDTIDRSDKRTAGEALEMIGVTHGKTKASIAKTVMEYTFETEHRRKPSFTDPQIERWVMDYEDTLTTALKIGQKSVENVSDPCLSQNEASTCALLMLLGGWGEQATVGYIASIQQGVATYPEAPTVILSKLYLRAKINARRADRLTKKAKIALAMKGAALWLEEKSVARMSWNPSKEPLPTHVKPSLAEPI